MAIKFNSSFAADFLRENDLIGLESQVKAAHEMVTQKNGLGNDFLGWVNLPTD
jgi:glucose-6-phosphate isomerase